MAPAKKSTEGRSRLPILLGLAVVIGGALLWDRWPDWSTEDAGAPAAIPDKISTEANELDGRVEPDGESRAPLPLSDLSLDRLHDTVRRPLFEKQRRPVEPPPAPAAATPAPPPVAPKRFVDPNALTLLGVLMNSGSGAGAGAIALMRRNQTGQNVRLQEGDTVDGWTIERIESARVHIRQGDTRIALELFRKR
jgi:hypothetical protein